MKGQGDECDQEACYEIYRESVHAESAECGISAEISTTDSNSSLKHERALARGWGEISSWKLRPARAILMIIQRIVFEAI